MRRDLQGDTHFYTGCGTEMINNHNPAENETPVVKPSRLMHLMPIIIPILSLFIVSVGVLFYYSHEHNINAEVLALRETAEKEALQGNYDRAVEQLEKAVKLRPSYKLLQEEMAVIRRAQGYRDSFILIGEKIKSSQFEEASKELASIKEKLSSEQGPLFEQFPRVVEDSEIKITVGIIKQELNALNTVEELSGKLAIISTLPEKEASAVKKEILNKIVQISIEQVETNLSNKQFSEAFKTIDRGLLFAVNDEKLLAMRDRVQQDKTAFEQAEQQRIEKAMEAAAQEDLKNRTAAVEVSDFSIEVDEFGDLFLTGAVKNIATTSISSITINYTIYDENGQYLDDRSTSVYPYALAPGEKGTFEDIYYGVYQTVKVEIDNITWYLN